MLRSLLRRLSVRAQLPAREQLEALGRVAEIEGDRVSLDVEPGRVAEVVLALLALPAAQDLSVQDAPLEEVMRELFRGTAAEPGA